MSISGLHVTMFAWLAGAAVMAVWRRGGRVLLHLPAQQAARWGGLAAAFGYAVFSGWGVPAQRTVWMLATVTVLQGLGRRWPWPTVLMAAAVAVSALDPWALLQPGFWLSFSAVGLLLASGAPSMEAGIASATDSPERWWRRGLRALGEAASGGLRTQVVASVGLAPLTLICFQQISLVGFLANLVAIPLITLVVTPLALLGVAAPGLWSLDARIVQRFCEALQWLNTVPGAVWVVPAAPLWAQLAGLLAAALLVMPLPWRLRLLAIPLALPVLMPPVDLPEAGRFELLAADVGQGTAVLVRTRHHLLLFDTGPQYSLDNDAGQRVLLPLLQARGETRIDRLVLSHRDADHVGGAATLIQALPVSDMLSSLEPGHPLLAMVSHGRRCEEGQSWDWDGVHFEVLHPQASDHGQRKLKPNALSCVLRVSGTQGSALLTGDIERAQESRLVASGALLESDILVVPHHGSRTSSTATFLDAVRPKVAIIQAGYRNRFGHPVAEVLARLESRHVLVHSSASCGAWLWPGHGTGFEGSCQRRIGLRYWHDGAAMGGLDFANLLDAGKGRE
jgi:competence protein ComEC